MSRRWSDDDADGHGVPVWVLVALAAWTVAVAFTIKPDAPPAQPAPPAPPTIEETP